MHTLIDVLKARGWTERDFNWNGDAAPYCRVGLSLLKQAAIFEVMPVWRRWLTPSSSPTVRSIFKGSVFRVHRALYDVDDGHHMRARWIDHQEAFPFGDWLRPIRFNVSSMKVARVHPDADSPSVFVVSYGALTVGNAFEVCLDLAEVP